jgi:hypothetical protein
MKQIRREPGVQKVKHSKHLVEITIESVPVRPYEGL